MNQKKEVGHNFLARMGKKRLRPGGIKATSWLLAQANINADSKLLEVACNRCTTSVELAQQYGCSIVAIDMDGQALNRAREHVTTSGLNHLISIVQGNALQLPFADESFDIVINEAMLTMLQNNAKAKAIAEYYRVLKPGGMLLTHDVMILKDEQSELIEQLRQTINVKVAPLSLNGWRDAFMTQGFADVSTSHGKMTLLNPIGLIRDEGLGGTLRIISNGLKKENRDMFRRMFSFFNHPDLSLEYIAVCSQKPASPQSQCS